MAAKAKRAGTDPVSGDFFLALEGRFEEVIDVAGEAVRMASWTAVKEAAEITQRELRQDLRSAGLETLEGTWRLEMFPSRAGQANNPAAWIYSRAEYIVAAFEEGVTIRSRDGSLMAVPIPDSPARDLRNPRGPETKVDEARRRFGELKVVPGVPGVRPAMLVAEGVGYTPTGRLSRRKRLKSGNWGKGVASVPLFFLVPQVRLEKRLNVQRIFESGSREFESRLNRALDHHLRQLETQS